MPGYQKEDLFELPVEYHGNEIVFPASLVQMGYTYKIFVTVDEHKVIFEPDEERNLRAVREEENNTKPIPIGLIRAIGHALEKYLR